MQKKLLAVIALLVFSLGTFTLAYADSPIKLILDGNELQSDAAPQSVSGRVLVPIRVIAQALGAQVSWDEQNNAVIIESKTVDAGKSQEARITQLERALAPKDPMEAVNTWAKGEKERNGAVQYAALSPELRKIKYDDFAAMNWVTGTTSPWVDSYKITDLGKWDDGSFKYKVDIVWMTSAGSSTGEEYITVKKYDNNFFVSSIDNVGLSGARSQTWRK